MGNKKKVSSYIWRGMTLDEVRDYQNRVGEISGGVYGERGVFMNEDAKKQAKKEIKKTEGYKKWKKAGGVAGDTRGYDAEGNRALRGSGTAKYDSEDTWNSESKKGAAASLNASLAKRGSALNYEDFNAADRWNYQNVVGRRDSWHTDKIQAAREAKNPYGKGNFDPRDMYGDPARVAKTNAQNAPPSHAALPMSTAASTSTPSITTPKETTRKALPKVSNRIKQKQRNRGAGIRT